MFKPWSHCRELSNGHFSDDNQKRLNGPDTDIPIFEAKMTRDLRLVVGRDWHYPISNLTIDFVVSSRLCARVWNGREFSSVLFFRVSLTLSCISRENVKVCRPALLGQYSVLLTCLWRPVLKIFGIYTHAQLDQRFWNSVGSQLGKKGGKEYKYR
jgi:hypothetical protein